MLILTRRLGETIRIGDDVVVTVLGVRGHQVRLGIAAPATVRVNRGELTHHRSVVVSETPSLAEAEDLLPFADTLGVPAPRLSPPGEGRPAPWGPGRAPEDGGGPEAG